MTGWQLVLFSSISILFLSLYFYFESKKLVFKVRLDSRKQFNDFNPFDYLTTLPEQKFIELQNIVQGLSKKNKLILKWSYTSPTGRVSLESKRKFTVNDLESYVEKMAPIFKTGSERINGLNKLYAKELEKGREVKDKIPKIYCYKILDSETHVGLLKVGYAKNNVHRRVKAQFKSAAHLQIPYEILFIMPAMTITGEKFMDHKVHHVLKKQGVNNPMGEWFECSIETAMQAVNEVQFNRN